MKNKTSFLLCWVITLYVVISSCVPKRPATKAANTSKGTTLKIDKVSTDPSYGVNADNPIKVGGGKGSEGIKNKEEFLNALTGPNGSELTYRHFERCCPYRKTQNGSTEAFFLDLYEVKWGNDQRQSLTLYMSVHESDTLKAPIGLGIKK